MSHFEKLAGFISGQLSFEEQKAIATFAKDMIKLAQAGEIDTLGEELQKALMEIPDQDTQIAILDSVAYIAKYAGAMDVVRKGLTAAYPYIMAATALAPLAETIATKFTRSKSLQTAKAEIQRLYPRVASSSNFDQFFNTLASFAPDIASQPYAAGRIIEDMTRMGPSSVNMATIGELINMQQNRLKSRGTTSVPITSMLAPALTSTLTAARNHEIQRGELSLKENEAKANVLHNAAITQSAIARHEEAKLKRSNLLAQRALNRRQP